MAGTLVANTINTDTGLFSTQNAYSGIAKAWVVYNGSTSTLINSFNVSSVTKVGTGDYTVNFTTAMPNANYSITSNSQFLAGNILLTGPKTSTAPTTTTCEFYVANPSQTLVDSSLFTASIFGN